MPVVKYQDAVQQQAYQPAGQYRPDIRLLLSCHGKGSQQHGIADRFQYQQCPRAAGKQLIQEVQGQWLPKTAMQPLLPAMIEKSKARPLQQVAVGPYRDNTHQRMESEQHQCCSNITVHTRHYYPGSAIYQHRRINGALYQQPGRSVTVVCLINVFNASLNIKS